MALVGAPPRGSLNAGDERQRFHQHLQALIDHRLWLREARRQFSTDELARLAQPTGGGLSHAAPLAEEARIVAAWKENLAGRDVSDAEVEGYFREHLDAYQTAEAVRWERITAPRESFGNTLEAWKTMLELRGRLAANPPGAAVAEALGPLQHEVHDWTTRREAPSLTIAQVLFNTSDPSWCEVIEDSEGFHLLRVRDRRPERYLTLAQAAPQIRQQLIDQRRAMLEAEHTAALRGASQIWSIQDARPDPGATAAW
jgi:hypothetical protein